jgi:transposase
MDDDDLWNDAFWNLVAAYIESTDREALRRECSADLFDRVARHVSSCPVCQEQCRVLAERAARDKPD